MWVHTLFLCTSSNRFSAAVFRSLLLLPAIAGELRPLPTGDAAFASSSWMARSKAFRRSSSGEAAFSFFVDFAFFFLHNRQRRLLRELAPLTSSRFLPR